MFTLLINPEKFDKEVWQIETEFKQKEYNEWLKGAIENLELIYDTYDVGGVVGEDCGDVSILGDIINMLANTEIKTDKHWEMISKKKRNK